MNYKNVMLNKSQKSLECSPFILPPPPPLQPNPIFLLLLLIKLTRQNATAIIRWLCLSVCYFISPRIPFLIVTSWNYLHLKIFTANNSTVRLGRKHVVFTGYYLKLIFGAIHCYVLLSYLRARILKHFEMTVGLKV